MGVLDKFLDIMKLSDDDEYDDDDFFDDEYDEEYEEYGCVVNMDEDDLAMLMQFKRATCPYFSYGDEYKIARKQ